MGVTINRERLAKEYPGAKEITGRVKDSLSEPRFKKEREDTLFLTLEKSLQTEILTGPNLFRYEGSAKVDVGDNVFIIYKPTNYGLSNREDKNRYGPSHLILILRVVDEERIGNNHFKRNYARAGLMDITFS